MIETLNIILILLTFGAVFYILFKWHKEENSRMDKILTTVFSASENTNAAFYQEAGKIEIAHFEQLEKLNDRNVEVFDKNIDKLLTLLEKKKEEETRREEEIISRFTAPEENDIEKQRDEEVNPLEELTPADFVNIKNVQFEGEEEIYPISTT